MKTKIHVQILGNKQLSLVDINENQYVRKAHGTSKDRAVSLGNISDRPPPPQKKIQDH